MANRIFETQVKVLRKDAGVTTEEIAVDFSIDLERILCIRPAIDEKDATCVEWNVAGALNVIVQSPYEEVLRAWKARAEQTKWHVN